MSPFNVDKTHHWPVISPLSANILKHLKEFFYYTSCVPAGPSKSLCLLLLICCGYANYKANRGFVIIFSICSDLLNDLRRTDTLLSYAKEQKMAKQHRNKGNHYFDVFPVPNPTDSINNTAKVSRLSFSFLWRWINRSSR